MIKYVETFAKSESSEFDNTKDEYLLKVSIAFLDEKNNPDISVDFDGITFNDYNSREIISKIRNSKTLIFHHSTQTRRTYGRYHGFYDDFSAEEREAIKKKRYAAGHTHRSSSPGTL